MDGVPRVLLEGIKDGVGFPYRPHPMFFLAKPARLAYVEVSLIF